MCSYLIVIYLIILNRLLTRCIIYLLILNSINSGVKMRSIFLNSRLIRIIIYRIDISSFFLFILLIFKIWDFRFLSFNYRDIKFISWFWLILFNRRLINIFFVLNILEISLLYLIFLIVLTYFLRYKMNS